MESPTQVERTDFISWVEQEENKLRQNVFDAMNEEPQEFDF